MDSRHHEPLPRLRHHLLPAHVGLDLGGVVVSIFTPTGHIAFAHVAYITSPDIKRIMLFQQMKDSDGHLHWQHVPDLKEAVIQHGGEADIPKWVKLWEPAPDKTMTWFERLFA